MIRTATPPGDPPGYRRGAAVAERKPQHVAARGVIRRDVCQGVGIGQWFTKPIRWMHRVRLYPTAAQERRLDFMLHATRHLYNAALQERRDAYRMRGVTVTAKMQYAELTALRAEQPGIATVYRECQDAVSHRIDLAMQRFFDV